MHSSSLQAMSVLRNIVKNRHKDTRNSMAMLIKDPYIHVPVSSQSLNSQQIQLQPQPQQYIDLLHVREVLREAHNINLDEIEYKKLCETILEQTTGISPSLVPLQVFTRAFEQLDASPSEEPAWLTSTHK
jgi:hypothetical protein